LVLCPWKSTLDLYFTYLSSFRGKELPADEFKVHNLSNGGEIPGIAGDEASPYFPCRHSDEDIEMNFSGFMDIKSLYSGNSPHDLP